MYRFMVRVWRALAAPGFNREDVPRQAGSRLSSQTLGLRTTVRVYRMRTLKILLLGFAAASLVACSTSSIQSAPQSQELQDQSEMMAALERSAESWNKADLKGHLAIYDESVTVMAKNGPRPTVAAIEVSFSQAYFKDGKQRARSPNLVVSCVTRRNEASRDCKPRHSRVDCQLPVHPAQPCCTCVPT